MNRTSQVEAVYRRGVFEPLGRVELSENERVSLTFRSHDRDSVTAWIQQISQVHRDIVRRVGPLPDSSREIAADRTR